MFDHDCFEDDSDNPLAWLVAVLVISLLIIAGFSYVIYEELTNDISDHQTEKSVALRD